jgi:hypothetical protein
MVTIERPDIHEFRRLVALGDKLPRDFDAALIHPCLSERTARAIFECASRRVRGSRHRHLAAA